MSKDIKISMIFYIFTNLSNAYFLIRIVKFTVFLTIESTRNPTVASFVTEYMQLESVKKTIANKFSNI